MPIKEVFPNPTVKQVVFQIRYPNLLFLENRIGEFQQSIMEKFPDSELLFRQQAVFVDLSPNTKIEEVRKPEPTRQIWRFISGEKVVLNVLTDSFDISSEYHKTYNNPSSASKFRDTIQFVTDAFLRITRISSIRRIGLRYIDECPIPQKNNEVFRSYYNSTFPLDRFSLADAMEMEFKTCITLNGYYLRYQESLRKKDREYVLVLDFDGYAQNVESGQYLAVTDRLHELIVEEYMKTIKGPVYDFMRRPPQREGDSKNASLQLASR